VMNNLFNILGVGSSLSSLSSSGGELGLSGGLQLISSRDWFALLSGGKGGGLGLERLLARQDSGSSLGDRVWVESSHGDGVSEWVVSEELALLGRSGLQHSLDCGRSGDSGDIGVGKGRSRENVMLLGGGSSSGGSPQGVELLEGILSVDNESSNVGSRSELQEVESGDVAEVNTLDVSHRLVEGGRCVGVDEQGSSLVTPLAVSGLSLSNSNGLGFDDLLHVGPHSEVLQHLRSGLGLGEVVDNRVADDQRKLRDVLDPVSSGHHQRGDSGGSDGGCNSESLLIHIHSSVPSSPDLEGSEHATLSAHVSKGSLSRSVGTSSLTRGILATARPVPQDSAEVCSPAARETA